MSNPIIGGVLVTPMRVPDWNQNDDKKSDYIKNRPLDEIQAVNSLRYYGDANIVPSDASLFRFTVIDATSKTASIVSAVQLSGDIVIPYECTIDSETYTVTTIGEASFGGQDGMTSITIPSSVRSILIASFDGCGNTIFRIPNTIETPLSGDVFGVSVFIDIYYEGTEEQWESLNGIEADPPYRNIYYECVPATRGYVNEKFAEIQNGGGGSVIVDQHLDAESENAISNKVVTEAVTELNFKCAVLNDNVNAVGIDVEGVRQQINQHAHFKGYVFTEEDVLNMDNCTPNDFAYCAETGTVFVYIGEEGRTWENTGEPVPDQMTPASDATPLVNGEASVGTENAYARGDHRHPTDTSRASAAELNALKSDISNALDAIIAIQNSLIGGDA